VDADIVHSNDVRMVEGSGRARFQLEPLQLHLVAKPRENLDRNIPAKARVMGPIHHSHRTGAERRHDLVGPETIAGRQLSHA